jgi:hypothetical protein
MRIDKPAGNVSRSSSSDRREQLEVAIGHLKEALKVLDAEGQAPDLGARVEECILNLRESLSRDC